MPYSVSRRAAHDLDELYRYGADTFGIDQADDYAAGLVRTFEFLASYPRAARERMETTPPVRAYPYKAHLIVYVSTDDDDVLIVRVRHSHEDWLVNPL